VEKVMVVMVAREDLNEVEPFFLLFCLSARFEEEEDDGTKYEEK
jgi:hypothetical protein